MVYLLYIFLNLPSTNVQVSLVSKVKNFVTTKRVINTSLSPGAYDEIFFSNAFSSACLKIRLKTWFQNIRMWWFPHNNSDTRFHELLVFAHRRILTEIWAKQGSRRSSCSNFFFFFFFKSFGGWVKIKLKLPHLHVSDTWRVSIICDSKALYFESEYGTRHLVGFVKRIS